MRNVIQSLAGTSVKNVASMMTRIKASFTVMAAVSAGTYTLCPWKIFHAFLLSADFVQY